MSTQQKATSTNNYDPRAMGMYRSFVPMWNQALQQNINDPWGMMGGNQMLASQNSYNAAQFGTANRNMINSFTSRGIDSTSPLFNQMLNRSANQNNASTMGGYNSLLQNATNFRNNAYYQQMAYSPLLTGGTQVQSQSGLGTWLPQVLQAGLQAGTAFAG